MNRIWEKMPEISGTELGRVQQFTADLSDKEFDIFVNVYRARRRDPQTVLIMALIGLFVIPGLQRFYLNQIGMGILYLFTIGLCWVGSIIDVVNYQNLTQEYNDKVLNEVVMIMRQPGV